MVKCPSEYIFFVSNKKKKKTHTQHKQNSKETKEKRKVKETKEQRENGNVVVLNSICGKSNGIR